jgi:uncharacterized Fe-S cluster-containing radical SAM superfamily protein
VVWAARGGDVCSDERVKSVARQIRGYDPIELGERIERIVQDGSKRKYFRFRGSRFYGGSAVGDVVGCNLRCAFCWTGRARDDLSVGFFVEAEEAARKLISIAQARGYRIVRLSAGEPTIGWQHLIRLLEFLESQSYGKLFILETNGILLGAYPDRVAELGGFRGIHVRVSLKACSPEWFKVLTGAKEESFWLPIRAIEELYSHNISFHFSIFAAFGSRECWESLLEEIARRTSYTVIGEVEVEALVLYSSSARRLRALERYGIRPDPKYVYKP